MTPFLQLDYCKTFIYKMCICIIYILNLPLLFSYQLEIIKVVPVGTKDTRNMSTNMGTKFIQMIYIPVRISFSSKFFKKSNSGTSLVVQWLRICLPMQGTQVQALVREDSTCRRATKPRAPQLLKLAHLEPMLRNKRSHHNKPTHRNEEQTLLAPTRESTHTATKTQRSQK